MGESLINLVSESVSGAALYVEGIRDLHLQIRSVFTRHQATMPKLFPVMPGFSPNHNEEWQEDPVDAIQLLRLKAIILVLGFLAI